MSPKLLRFLSGIAAVVVFSGTLSAQNCIPTSINDTTINLACNQVCPTLKFQIPHIKGTSDYTVVSVPYTPYPYLSAAGAESPILYNDDQYGDLINLPFPFCFYDSLYSKAVVGSNGLVTFDETNATSCFNAYAVKYPIPNIGGAFQCATPLSGFQTVPYYPKACIMGLYSDLDPIAPGSSPPDIKIQWHVEGTAPCRKFVFSFYHISVYSNPLFGDPCPLANPNTFQIVIHESTGIIEVFFEQKACFSSTNNGNAILGIQNWARDKAVAAPGKNLANWTENNTGYRFIPSGAGSKYISSQLYTLANVLVVAADTATTVPGMLDLSFPNVCPPAGNSTYVIKTIFSSCNGPAQLINYDTVFVNRNNALNATASTTNTTCGPPSGTITVTVPAGTGTPPYSYQLDAGVPQVSGSNPFTFSNVDKGPHTVTVTDFSGSCSSILNNVVVNLTNSLTAATATTVTACPGVNNGTITVTPANGTAPFTFSLDAAAPQSGAAPYMFTNVAAGPHAIIVTDAGGCISGNIPVTVSAGPPLTTTVGKTDVLCNGGATGSITVTTPSTGTPPYQYSLDNITWQAGNTFPGLAAANYTVYYRESNGCQGSQTITVAEPVALSAAVSATAVLCNGQNNGIITVTATNGTPPYQYSIDGGATWQSINTFNVVAGTYTITTRDVDNCMTSGSVLVTEPVALTGSATSNNASCGGNDGTITVIANGGNPGYQYSVDGITFQPLNILNVASGTYTVTIKDNSGCTTTLLGIIVGLTNSFSLTPQRDTLICEGTSAQLQVISNATQYSWAPATGLSNANISNPVADPVVTTQYIVTATLGSCSANDTVIVNVNAAPVPDAGPDGFICYGQTYQLQASGGTTFSWTPSTYLSSPSVANPVAAPDITTIYSLSVVGANGCHSVLTDDVTVDVTPPIHVATFPYDTIGYPGDQFQLLATSVANIYTWSPSTGLNNFNIPDPIVTVGAIGDDVVYKVVASTMAGCKGEGFVRVKVYSGPDIYVPTGFTPNNDGKNDKFIPVPVGIKQINYFRIFNRWGQMMFSTTRLNDGWDGKYAGKEQPTAVYVWMVEGITKDNRVIKKKGTVVLIR
jgi:gliding motility-associated-like protein